MDADEGDEADDEPERHGGRQPAAGDARERTGTGEGNDALPIPMAVPLANDGNGPFVVFDPQRAMSDAAYAARVRALGAQQENAERARTGNTGPGAEEGDTAAPGARGPAGPFVPKKSPPPRPPPCKAPASSSSAHGSRTGPQNSSRTVATQYSWHPYEGYTVILLQEMCRDCELNSKGNKCELIARLESHAAQLNGAWMSTPVPCGRAVGALPPRSGPEGASVEWCHTTAGGLDRRSSSGVDW